MNLKEFEIESPETSAKKEKTSKDFESFETIFNADTLLYSGTVSTQVFSLSICFLLFYILSPSFIQFFRQLFNNFSQLVFQQKQIFKHFSFCFSLGQV